MKRVAVVDGLLGVAAIVAVVSAIPRTAPARAQGPAPRAQSAVAAAAEPDYPNAAGPLARSPFRINEHRTEEEPVEQVARPIMVPMGAVSVRAIVGGPPWSALLVGVPGCGGSCVVRPGDRFQELRILRIHADRVSLAWADSTFSVALPPRAAP